MKPHPAPGEYILLQRMGKPPWPALVCTDDMAPKKVLDKRPIGFYTLVLVIKKKPEFDYAATSAMMDFDPFGSTLQNQDPELSHAYDAVLEELDSPGSSLDHWRLVTEDQHSSSYLPSPSPSSDPDSEALEDGYVREAKRLNLVEVRASTKGFSATVSPQREPKKARVIPKSFSTQMSGGIRRDLSPLVQYDSEGLEKIGSRRHKPDKQDYIGSDLSKSTEMVKVYVGKGKGEQEFLIPRSEVDKYPSLSHAKIGCMAITDDGTPRLDLPCFREFNPDDFKFVAEFLSTGKFGHTHIDRDNRDKVLAECAAAWPIADRLVLEDLLDLIVVKIQPTRPWQLEEAATLAELVYHEEGSALDAYVSMKEMLADFIADNFHQMALRMGANFLTPLQRLPELQRDLYQRLFEKAQEKMETD